MEARKMGSDCDSAGFFPQPAPRKRPLLRTYGRRAQPLPDSDSEPPRKKRVVAHNKLLEKKSTEEKAQKENSPPSSPQLPKLPVPSPAPVAVKKGSILAFFKPVQVATSSSAQPSQISSDATHDAVVPSSPPSSPPVMPRPVRKRRRLTTRINLRSDRKEDDAVGEQESEGNEQEEPNVQATTEEGDEKKSLAKRAHSSVLQELHSCLLNSAGATDGRTLPDGLEKKNESKRRVQKAAVQTTLNISDKPGFTICKDCDMLYNPLNEKDKKDHARQHAAAMRRQAKSTV
ncbi:hypothetical protein GE09DRAFT_343116 [Coniochaeta sp. 2T2.1]|nr:hypothetical protein GE09DRAFT_343116 [Coniochaeta sp. 2T2.1]